MGSGTVDGMGWNWWLRQILKYSEERPHMFMVYTSENMELTGIRVMNSPHFNIDTHDTVGQYFHDFEIYTTMIK